MKTVKTNTGSRKLKAILFSGFFTFLTVSCEDRAMEELRQVSEIPSAPAIPSEPNAATEAEIPPAPPAPPVPTDPGPLEKE
ncbi:hypothetical protein [Nafulsella turpanensis]|uniref:hypothetical protein n=1 Tax=Nafulsella turpanensis TaxID=1265690 RepID=UPI0003771DDE|nr:hypothetical protein [Nafulsella turpanensis]